MLFIIYCSIYSPPLCAHRQNYYLPFSLRQQLSFSPVISRAHSHTHKMQSTHRIGRSTFSFVLVNLTLLSFLWKHFVCCTKPLVLYLLFDLTQVSLVCSYLLHCVSHLSHCPLPPPSSHTFTVSYILPIWSILIDGSIFPLTFKPGVHLCNNSLFSFFFFPLSFLFALHTWLALTNTVLVCLLLWWW